MMRVVRTIEDKDEQLKLRKEQHRELGKTIDKIMSDGQNAQHGRSIGCGGPGLCPMFGRGVARILGLSGRVGAVATSEIDSASDRKGARNATAGNFSLALFGKPLGNKATAAGKLEAATVAMRARVHELDRRIAQCRATSLSAMKSGNKVVAMRELKRAKMLEKQAISTQSALDAVEAQSDMLEQTALQREVASALGATAKSLKKDKSLLSNAEDAVDAAVEMRDLHDDLSQVMSGLGESTSNEYDDDSIMQELFDMMSDDNENQKTTKTEPVIKAQQEIEEHDTDDGDHIRQSLPNAPTGMPTRFQGEGRTTSKLGNHLIRVP